MLFIKAVNFLHSKQFIASRYGEDVLQKVIAGMDAEDRALVGDPSVLSNAWFPMGPWTRFFEGAVKQVAVDEKSMLVEAGQHNGRLELTGVYKVFLKLGSPEFIMRRAVPLFRSYFKRDDEKKLQVEIRELGPGRFEIDVVGFDPGHRYLEWGLLGWILEVFKLAGAKELNADLIRSVSDGGEHSIYLVQWKR